ncbi:MAG: NADPH-dependent assimilatory sulfite reductase hemoprotein subunit, partial [Holophagales bacterium]|nr:NADPH-dependent assimilatory sulfite reductase hemoprotein subunit [Holophagales bacterium]
RHSETRDEPGKRRGKPSKVEAAKEGSRLLRGTIAGVLDGDAAFFEHDDTQLLKFHGIYQQDDRDARAARRATGADKAWSFMVRTRIPGGVLPADAYLGLAALADRVTHDRSLRITTRQTVQFHGIVKGELQTAIAEMNAHLITTLAACGDVGRNVMAPAAPLGRSWRAVRELADELSNALLPATRAYHEIWIDGQKADLLSSDSPAGGELGPTPEPLYGPTYLPRKFKVAVALPEDNTVDVHTQDVGLVAVLDEDGETIRGVDLLVGGGLGMTHRKADTFARLATPLGHVAREHAAAAVRTVAEIFRDHGNRSDRKHARLKYLIEDWGEERFREEFRGRAPFALEPWVDVGPLHHRDATGVHRQADGRYFVGLWIENGRLVDRGRRRLGTAVREIVAALRPTVVLTPDQNLLLTGLAEEEVPKVERILEAYGCEETLHAPPLRRYALACPALPTCGLALTESERVVSHALDDLEAELRTLGLEDEPLTVRMTGCPNGCARPYTADLAFVGRKPGKYDIFVGGGLAGDRLADLWAVEVP